MKNMNKLIAIILVAFLGQISYAQDAYEIKVKIKGLKQGDTLLMANHFGEKVLRADTAIVNKQGVGVFTGSKKLFRGMYLMATPDFKTYDFVINDDQFFEMITDSAKNEFQKNMVIKGSDENEAFFKYVNYISDKSQEREELMQELKSVDGDTAKMLLVDEKIQRLNKEVLTFQNNIFNNDEFVFAKILAAQKEPVVPVDLPDSLKYQFYKTNFWNTFDFSEEGLVRAPNALVKSKIDLYFDRLVVPNADSIKKEIDYIVKMASVDREMEKYTIWYLGHKYQKNKAMCMDDVYIHIIQQYYCTGRAWWTDSAQRSKMCQEATAASFTPCNGAAPNMANYDTADNVRELYKETGDITIVFFWDPTCGHCKKVIPILDSIYDANRGKGWKIYAIGSENKYTEWRKYLREHPEIHDWVNVCKNYPYAPLGYGKTKYNNVSNPTIYILDRERRIRAKKIPETSVAEFLKYLENMQGIREFDEDPKVDKINLNKSGSQLPINNSETPKVKPRRK